MKTPLLLGSALGILLLAGTASAAAKTYTATLNVTQETPTPTGVESPTGTANDITYDPDTKHLKGTLTYINLSGAVTSGHLHRGECGVPGDVVDALATTLTSPIAFDLILDDDDAALLDCGGLYLNLHTTKNAGGEIRGQVLKTGAPSCTGQKAATPACVEPAGDDAGASSSGGSSSGATSSSGSTETPTGDAGASSSGGSSSGSSSGCATTGSSPGGSLALVLGVGLAITALARGRRKK